MEDEELAHLAGLVDGAGSISVHVNADSNYRLGYRYQPLFRLFRNPDETTILGKLDAYCDEYGIRYNIVEKTEETIVFEVTHQESIARFLEPLIQWLVSRYDDALLMLDTILPAIEDGRLETEEGFYEMVGYADTLRSRSRSGSQAKYTQEFFENEWELED